MSVLTVTMVSAARYTYDDPQRHTVASQLRSVVANMKLRERRTGYQIAILVVVNLAILGIKTALVLVVLKPRSGQVGLPLGDFGLLFQDAELPSTEPPSDNDRGGGGNEGREGRSDRRDRAGEVLEEIVVPKDEVPHFVYRLAPRPPRRRVEASGGGLCSGNALGIDGGSSFASAERYGSRLGARGKRSMPSTLRTE
jgi:hypothetical protein